MEIEETVEPTEIGTPESTEIPVEETQSPEAGELSEESIVAAASEAAGDVEPDAGGESEAEKFEANYKFKVMEEEHEIDEAFRGIMTTKEAADKVRDLHEKAFGLDHVKADRDRFRDTSTEYKTALETQTTAINTLSGYLDGGDYESFFKALNIPTKDVMKYALTEAQRETWTPEQRAQHDQSWETKRRANVYQEQYNSNQNELESLRQEQVVKDYQLELYRPEVQEFQQAFDQRNGKDAFRSEVAQLGEFHEKVHEKILPIGDLVKSVMNKFGPFMQQMAPAAQPAAQTQSAAQPREVPVIPNTGPAGQAPAQKAITSLKDIEDYANSL